jgi:tRNA (guanine-N7-)-methyltransferase
LSEELHDPRRIGAGSFFGRRQGKQLSPLQAMLLDSLLPQLIVDLGTPAPSDIRNLFSTKVDHLRLEIGFGGGEHLWQRLREHEDTGFIGVEPFVNGMAKVLSRLHTRPASNIRLFNEDAALLLDWLPAECLDHIDILYPDPWPKKRQNKRRFISEENLVHLHRVLKPGGRLCFASDIAEYVNWTLAHVRQHGGFSFSASNANDWREPYAGWPGTRYEAKAHREGRIPAYLTFEKLIK